METRVIVGLESIILLEKCLLIPVLSIAQRYRYTVLSIRAGSRPKQPATRQSLAGYFRPT